MTQNCYLSTQNITKITQGKTLCDTINIEVARGKIVGLFGANGAGKSTCFNIIAGLIQPSSGHVMLDNEIITSHPIHVRSQNGIRFLPQDSSIFLDLTVYENILGVVQLTNNHPKSKQTVITNDLIDKFQLNKVAHTLGRRVSGGERRRTEIARACVNNPRYLLLDEPFSGVDPISVEEIKAQILELARHDDVGIFITDHHVKATLPFCDYAYILHHGKMLYQGVSDDVMQNDQVRQHYLGNVVS